MSLNVTKMWILGCEVGLDLWGHLSTDFFKSVEPWVKVGACGWLREGGGWMPESEVGLWD